MLVGTNFTEYAGMECCSRLCGGQNTECFHGIYNQQEDRETFEALWHKSVFQPAWVDMQHHVSVSWATYRLYFPYTELKYQWPNVKCGLLTRKLTDSRSLARKATNEKNALFLANTARGTIS